MAKDLTTRKKCKPVKRSSTFSRAVARYRERRNSLRETEMPAQAEPAKSVQPGETLIEHYVCSKTGQPFHLVWHRADAGEQFRMRELVKDSDGGAHGQRQNNATATLQVVSVEQFNFSGLYCPCCACHLGFVYCSCGDNVCGAGRYMRNGEERFKHAKCGADFKIGPPVRVIGAHAPSSAGTALVIKAGNMPKPSQ